LRSRWRSIVHTENSGANGWRSRNGAFQSVAP
jgi:hypothetical protein